MGFFGYISNIFTKKEDVVIGVARALSSQNIHNSKINYKADYISPLNTISDLAKALSPDNIINIKINPSAAYESPNKNVSNIMLASTSEERKKSELTTKDITKQPIVEIKKDEKYYPPLRLAQYDEPIEQLQSRNIAPVKTRSIPQSNNYPTMRIAQESWPTSTSPLEVKVRDIHILPRRGTIQREDRIEYIEKNLLENKFGLTSNVKNLEESLREISSYVQDINASSGEVDYIIRRLNEKAALIDEAYEGKKFTEISSLFRIEAAKLSISRMSRNYCLNSANYSEEYEDSVATAVA